MNVKEEIVISLLFCDRLVHIFIESSFQLYFGKRKVLYNTPVVCLVEC